jgi:Uma2 family endonuclease
MVSSGMASLRIRTRRWTRQEYDRLIEFGVLQEDDPIELIEGRLVVAEPQRDPHARAVELVAETLRRAFGRGWRVRVQLPLALGHDSAPEPDVSVVRGTPRDAPSGHPTTAALVVEIADSSLPLDRGPKAQVYARAGIADYWIVNLIDRVLEVCREPSWRGPRGRARYTAVETLGADATLAPLAAPDATISVADLLP